MDRRTFLYFALALTAQPTAAWAQAAGKQRRIGVLSNTPPFSPEQIRVAYAPLADMGWIEGKNLIVERRYTSGDLTLLRPFAEELVRLKVELILAFGTDATIAARSATATIPIVIISAADPVLSGLVTSLARPGGNITGYSIVSTEMDAKRLELLRELLPDAKRIGELVARGSPASGAERPKMNEAYRSLQMEPIVIEVATSGELENAVAEVARRGGQALMVPNDGVLWSNQSLLMSAALRHALPTVVDGRDWLEVGGLISYGTTAKEMQQAFAFYVDKILRGASPADLPLRQPTKFELMVNLKTAKALNLAIPQSLLLRADQIIR